VHSAQKNFVYRIILTGVSKGYIMLYFGEEGTGVSDFVTSLADCDKIPVQDCSTLFYTPWSLSPRSWFDF